MDDAQRKARAFDEVRRALREGASVDRVLGMLRGMDESEEEKEEPEREPRTRVPDNDDDLFFR